MCKKNELLGSIIMACGAGVLIALLFASDFLQALIGIVLLIGGLFCTRKQC